MKFVSEIFKLSWNCVRDRICFSLCSESVKLFIRQLFNMAEKRIDVDLNILSYPAPFPPANIIEIRSLFLRSEWLIIGT